MKNSIIDGMSFAAYCEILAANKSGLDLIDRSPLHFWADKLDPKREPEEETPAKRLGKAIHAAILEPHLFAAEYRRKPSPVEFPTCLNTADEYKERCKQLGLPISGTKDVLKARILEVDPTVEFFDDIEERFSKYKLLSFDDMRTAVTIAKNVRGSKMAEIILAQGKAEQTIVWTDKETGVLCKARADWLTDDLSTIVDFKSTQDASPNEFLRSFVNYNYHRQAAWYLDGVKAVTGTDAIFVFPVYETKPPYACAYYYARPAAIEHGRIENRKLLRIYAECLAKQKWPGYCEEIMPLDLPAWKMKQLDESKPQPETY